MLRCPNCQHRNPDHARYCQQCSINLGDYLRAVQQGQTTSPRQPLSWWAWLRQYIRHNNQEGKHG